MTTSQRKVSVSVIVPALNEAESLPVLTGEIEKALAPLPGGFEVIIVDDGSTDNTREVVEKIVGTRPFVKGIFFERNFGQSSALDAGIRACTGERIVFIDADLQNDPADIPRLLEKLDEYDVAVGWRTRRKDPWTKRATSRIANLARRLATGDPTHDAACTLKAFRRPVLEKIKLYDGMHRFLSTLALMEGARVAEVEINHRPRRFGRSKYSIFNRFMRPTLDLLAVMWMKRRRLKYRINRDE